MSERDRTDPWIGSTTYAACCRPKLSDLLQSLGLDAAYTKASGAYLYRSGDDGAGTRVLDLVGGFGAGLLGHNNSELKELLKEQLDADKLQKVIDRFVYTGKEPLPDPDIIELIQRPLKLAERGPARKRVLEKVVDFVETFITGIAA